MKFIVSALPPRIRRPGLVCFVFALLTIPATTSCIMLEPGVEPGGRADRNPQAHMLPMTFQENLGQNREDARYLARGNGYSLFVGPEGAALRLGRPVAGVSESSTGGGSEVLRITLVDADPNAEPVGLSPTTTKSHYFIGNDPSRWRRNVPGYSRVEFRSVYKGIDTAYRGAGADLEYDFIVHPGAEPGDIRLRIEGANRVHVDGQGNLVSEFEHGNVIQGPPTVYQDAGGKRQIVDGGYTLDGDEVGFRIGPYDTERTLVIDPVLTYSTYLGGSGVDTAFEVVVDGDGNAYLTGTTASTDFPTAEPLQADALENGDVFIAKLNSDGSGVAFVTYFGGDSIDVGRAIALDSVGNVFVAGATDSTNFPLQAELQASSADFLDAFVMVLSPDGDQLLYSTYLGGESDDIATDIALDSSDNILVTGETDSQFFPIVNAYQDVGLGISNAFITKYNSQGSAMVFSTYLGFGSSGRGIVADEDRNVWVTGLTSTDSFPRVNAIQATAGGEVDAFVSQFDQDGALEFSTYLGGSLEDRASGIVVDSSGAIVVVGQTFSTDFPTANAFQPSRAVSDDDAPNGDGFVTVIDPASPEWAYSTYLGGSANDSILDVAVGGQGGIFVAGSTDSDNFPTSSPIQAKQEGLDVFVTRFAAGSYAVTYSTYIGGSGAEIASGVDADDNGNVYVIGSTDSTDFPILGPFQSTSAGSDDIFVFQITPDQTTFSLNGGGASFMTPGDDGTTIGGYAQIIPEAGSTTPPGMAIFSFLNQGVVVSEASVPASTPIQSGRIYAEIGGSANTGLAIANPTSETAEVSFFFTDQEGSTVSSGSLSLAANEHIARFLSEDEFNMDAPFEGTFTFGASVPVAVVALRGFTNQRGEFLTTTLPVTKLPSNSTDTVYFPHFADGDGWTTQIILVNTGGAPASGTVEFWDTSGQPFELTLADSSIGSEFAYSISSRSSVRLETADIGGVVTGSVRVVPDEGSLAPSGLGIFSLDNNGIRVSEAGVPASPVGSAFRSYVESSGTPGLAGSIRTGVAIANISEDVVTATFELTLLDGTATGLSEPRDVPGSGQTSLFLDELFPTLENPFSGIVRISSPSASIALVGLRARTNQNDDFLITTTPAANEADPPSIVEMFFPRFADAGGWRTQFILFSGANQSSAGVLRFFDEAGRILDLPLS